MDLVRVNKGSGAATWAIELATTGLVILLVGLAWLVLFVWLFTL
jgi:hypothetical protein